MAVAEGDAHVLSIDRQIHHRRIFAAAGATRPQRPITHFGVLVGDRRGESFRVELGVECLDEGLGGMTGAAEKQGDGENEEAHVGVSSEG